MSSYQRLYDNTFCVSTQLLWQNPLGYISGGAQESCPHWHPTCKALLIFGNRPKMLLMAQNGCGLSMSRHRNSSLYHLILLGIFREQLLTCRYNNSGTTIIMQNLDISFYPSSLEIDSPCRKCLTFRSVSALSPIGGVLSCIQLEKKTGDTTVWLASLSVRFQF